MRFEWDEAKNRQNLAKHGINFETAALVFEDPYVLSDPDRVVDDEERWQTIGTIGVLILVGRRRRRGDSLDLGPKGELGGKKIL
jgi:uncharacterized protein